MISYIKSSDLEYLESEYSDFYLFSEFIQFYKNEEKQIIITPGFLKNIINDDKIINHEDPNFKIKKINIEFRKDKSLKDRQFLAFNTIFEIYNKKGFVNGIIKARCRFGKTILTSYLISYFKQKTLIIVDSKALLQQWINDMVAFLNIDESQIGLFNDKSEDLNKPIVIAMVQSINSKIRNKVNLKYYFNQFHNAGFGFVYIDEAHSTASAKEYSKATMILNTKNILGLTATPNQNNINKFLVESTIGDVIFEYKDYELIPDVYFVKFKSGMTKLYSKIKNLRMNKRYIEASAVYQSSIENNEIYLEKIIKLSLLILENQNRRLMILVNTCNAENSIGNRLKIFFERANIKTTLLFGKNNIIDDDSRIILATYKKGHRGITVNNLTDLIFAANYNGNTPLIQSSGRLLGIVENFDKPIPRVFHLIDESIGNIFINSIETKKNIYQTEYGEDIIFHEI